MEAIAQHDAGLVDRAVEIQAATRLGTAEQREAGARSVEAIEGGDRDVRRVVLIAAEGAAEPFLHANDGELDAFDAHDSADGRRIAGEERGANRVADDGEVGARAVLLVGEEAAVDDSDVADAGHRGGNPDDRAVLADLVLALDVADMLAIGAVEDVLAVDGFHEARVVRANRFVALELVEELAAAEAAGGGDLGHHEALAAERLRSALLGIHTQAFNGCAHQDDAGHPDDHSEQRQEAAQLMRADRIHRQEERVFEVIPRPGEPRTALCHVVYFQDNVIWRVFPNRCPYCAWLI